MRPTWEGVEAACRECGHIYPSVEFRELLARQAWSAALPSPCPPEGEPR